MAVRRGCRGITVRAAIRANWHDPMPAVRALLVALDAWVVSGPVASEQPRAADRRRHAGTGGKGGISGDPGVGAAPHAANDAAPLEDWVSPAAPGGGYGTLVPQVGADGNEVAGIRLPDIAVPRGTFTGWNLYKAPYPDGELADREGTFLAFAATEAERGDDPRASLAARYPGTAYGDAVRSVVAALRADRLLLDEDAERFITGS